MLRYTRGPSKFLRPDMISSILLKRGFHESCCLPPADLSDHRI